MNSEPKAFASLSSGLLARKGAARPAMRPQGFGQMGAAGLDDLGWNDMGFEAPKAVLASVERDADHDAFGDAVPEPSLRNPVGGLTPFSPVHAAQAELAERFIRDAEMAGEDDLDESAESLDLADPVLQAVVVEAKKQVVFDEPEPQLAPEHPSAIEVEPVTAFTAPAARRQATKAARPAASGKAKAAFTLRLEPSRHLKLRLACAVTGHSAQQLVTRALDALLAGMPELDAMAQRAPLGAAQKD